MEETAKLVATYGVGTVITALAVWIAVDLYFNVIKKKLLELFETCTKEWAPRFLASFERIADSSERTAGSVDKLTTEVQGLKEEVKHHSEDFEVVKTKLGSLEQSVEIVHQLVVSPKNG
jgi:predicted nuclease with TOPRIM domain